jgi:hypothetical protein
MSTSCCSVRNLIALSLWLIRPRLKTTVLFAITSQVNLGYDQRPSLLRSGTLSNVYLRINHPSLSPCHYMCDPDGVILNVSLHAPLFFYLRYLSLLHLFLPC